MSEQICFKIFPRFLFTLNKRENTLNLKTTECLQASLLLFAKYSTSFPDSACLLPSEDKAIKVHNLGTQMSHLKKSVT